MRGRRLPTPSQEQTSINPKTRRKRGFMEVTDEFPMAVGHPALSSERPGRPTDTDRGWLACILGAIKGRTHQCASLKGGDPAAGSPTATLLRLHPSR